MALLKKLNLKPSQSGFNLEQLSQVNPRLVVNQSLNYNEGKNNNKTAVVQKVDYEVLIPMLVGSIKEQQQQIIVDYLTGDFEPPKARRSKLVCQIDDNEARAVQRLILDMQGQSEVLDDWLDAIICRYFYNNSWAEMKNSTRTEMDAKFDVKCGLAALHVRYGFIRLLN